MNYSSVESSLHQASKKLDLVSSRRERLIKESRDIISLSAKAIVSIHAGSIAEADELSKEVKRKLRDLRRVAGSDLVRYLLTPEQEFVELSVILAVSKNQRIPSLESLGVTPSSYILGLLDAVGELKRSAYDVIRKGEIKEAEKRFATMESLYTMLSPFSVYDNIVQGVKRKIDVARILIEDTRSVMTEETRRSEFMEAVKDLSDRLGAAPLLDHSHRRGDIIDQDEREIRQNREDGQEMGDDAAS